MPDLCYICKKPCDKADIMSCAYFEYDERKSPIGVFRNKDYYGMIPIRYISIKEV